MSLVHTYTVLSFGKAEPFSTLSTLKEIQEICKLNNPGHSFFIQHFFRKNLL